MDPDPYSEYGSRKLLNTDLIRIRIHNTVCNTAAVSVHVVHSCYTGFRPVPVHTGNDIFSKSKEKGVNTVLFINYIKDTEVRRLVNPKSNIDAMGLNPAASGAAAAVFKYLGVLGSGGEDGAFRYLQVLGFNFRKLPSWACTTSLGFGLLRHPPPFPALIVTKAFAPLRPIFLLYCAV